jgi:tRNA A-37 threonylcarbamoyl transferase component Bud32
VRLQFANPAEHPHVGSLPFATDLAEWDLPHMRRVLGLHRHVVRLIELGDEQQRTSYVVKELPDHLARREYRLLRSLAADRLPTVVVVAVVTDRSDRRDGLLVTRHLDYSLPYRNLLAGQGMTIPYLGERVLSALVGLLVRLHLAGFFWGDCSLSNTLFRRDAGELGAYIIDVETSERYERLSDGQRALDLQIATENVAGGLLDLQAGGRLVKGVDPWQVAENIESSYNDLWAELTDIEEFTAAERWRVDERLRRIHDLGFDVGEMEMIADESGEHLRLVPRVVESGYHQDRLFALTGVWAGENQARRLLDDIRSFAAELNARTGSAPSESIAAVRWLDQRFEPIIAAIPPSLTGKLEPAELYHQLLEHRWFLAERHRRDVSLEEALESYIPEVLTNAPDEAVSLDVPTSELVLPDLSGSPPADE